MAMNEQCPGQGSENFNISAKNWSSTYFFISLTQKPFKMKFFSGSCLVDMVLENAFVYASISAGFLTFD